MVQHKVSNKVHHTWNYQTPSLNQTLEDAAVLILEVPETHLLPNDNQDNERDNDNHQQHQHRGRHCELRSQGWGQDRDTVENFVSYSWMAEYNGEPERNQLRLSPCWWGNVQDPQVTLGVPYTVSQTPVSLQLNVCDSSLGQNISKDLLMDNLNRDNEDFICRNIHLISFTVEVNFDFCLSFF